MKSQKSKKLPEIWLIKLSKCQKQKQEFNIPGKIQVYQNSGKKMKDEATWEHDRDRDMGECGNVNGKPLL